MAKELIKVYDTKGKLLDPQDREEFYNQIFEEYKTTGKITRLAGVVWILLMTPSGRMYVQKRGHLKKENAGMYDKSVGGHVKYGHTEDLTATFECMEELGIGINVLDGRDFIEARDSEYLNLSIMGIARRVDQIVGHTSLRVLKGGKVVPQPVMVTIYAAVFNGPILFQDGESCGIETFSLEELQEAMKRNPEQFTGDLRFVVENYSSFLVPLDEQSV